ncbi:cation:proton antiporter [Paludibacterium purpuratum]|uniref:Kef-type K+ transport system membrane component KefB n=1 Tax=Paludibacterium purpuratum TaxID=1144873 RepID=A0A4R7B095_9NEIS|nr:cation:proton antiporter [Paludibacterium purpuratum]TDR73834.1 Kef-type K+ transport system membrane component KefB [Paludibacterium purpuratum]
MTLPFASTSLLNPLTALGIILALGILGGQIARKSSAIPTLTGYIVTGLIIGPHGLGLISQPLIDTSDIFVQLALGIALFEMGRRIDLRWLRHERALLVTALGGGAVCFLALYLTLSLFGVHQETAAVLAILALSCSPAALLEVLRETRAEGQVSERLVTYAGIGNLLALTGYCLTLGWSRQNGGLALESWLLQPSWTFLGSAGIGLMAGLVAINANRWIGAQYREAQEVLLFALIALTVGLSSALHMLPALALLIFGLSTRNMPSGYAVGSPWVMRYSVVFFAALFVIAGSRLDLRVLGDHLPLALLFVCVRSALHILTGALMAHANGLARRCGALMGLALMPMSGTANLALLTSPALLPASASAILPLAIATLCLTELIGPPLTQLALKLAGETRPHT